jgi:hypothetical protein
LNEEKNKTSMGIPTNLSDPSVIFPRTFRFLFVPAKYPDIRYLITKVVIDYYQQTFNARILETAPGLSSQDWIIEMKDKNYSDDYKLIALDGLGNELYVLDLKGANAVSHSVEYEYASSEVVTHHVGFEYKELVRSKNLPKA